MNARADIVGRLSKLIQARALARWLYRPNPAFGGKSPEELMEAGDYAPLLRMLEELEGGCFG